MIGTHHGTFHCDEALACAMLKLLPEFADMRESSLYAYTMIADAPFAQQFCVRERKSILTNVTSWSMLGGATNRNLSDLITINVNFQPHTLIMT